MKRLLLRTLLLAWVLVFPIQTMAETVISIHISLPPAVRFAEAPQLVVLPETYIYAVPDIDEDIFFYNGWWWRQWEERWYRSRNYNSDWEYYQNVPPFYKEIPSGWRNDYREHRWKGHQWRIQQVSHQEVERNWKSWEKSNYWKNQQTWGVEGLQSRTRSQSNEVRRNSLPPALRFAAPPQLIVLPETYVYFVPDIDADIFFCNGSWWRQWEERWYRSSNYNSDWEYSQSVPSFYKEIPSGWRNDYKEHRWKGHQWRIQQVSHRQVEQNWKSWEKSNYWEKRQTWGVEGLQSRTLLHSDDLRYVSLPPALRFDKPPQLIVLPETYIYAIPDIDADIFFCNGYWWRQWEERWYRSSNYNSDWKHYQTVPSFYKEIPSGWRNDYREHRWRGHQWRIQQVSHQQVQQNWKVWEKSNYWEKQQTWGVQGLQPRTRQQQPPQNMQLPPPIPKAVKPQGSKQPSRNIQSPRSRTQPKAVKPQRAKKPSRNVQSPQSRTKSKAVKVQRAKKTTRNVQSPRSRTKSKAVKVQRAKKTLEAAQYRKAGKPQKSKQQKGNQKKGKSGKGNKR